MIQRENSLDFRCRSAENSLDFRCWPYELSWVLGVIKHRGCVVLTLFWGNCGVLVQKERHIMRNGAISPVVPCVRGSELNPTFNAASLAIKYAALGDTA